MDPEDPVSPPMSLEGKGDQKKDPAAVIDSTSHSTKHGTEPLSDRLRPVDSCTVYHGEDVWRKELSPGGSGQSAICERGREAKGGEGERCRIPELVRGHTEL